jgi:hypothetical protein
MYVHVRKVFVADVSRFHSRDSLDPSNSEFEIAFLLICDSDTDLPCR